jgi:hypothetical protein
MRSASGASKVILDFRFEKSQIYDIAVRNGMIFLQTYSVYILSSIFYSLVPIYDKIALNSFWISF